MIPRALEEIRIPQLLAAQRYLLLGKHIRFADLQRHVLAVGILLQIAGEHERLDASVCALARTNEE